MENVITLEKIDLIRERMGVSYKEAREALEQANGEVVDALVILENKPGVTPAWREEVATKGNDLLVKVKEIVRQGNVTKVRIKHKDNVLLEIPVTAGAVGAILAPQLAAVGVIAALFAQCTIEIERKHTVEGQTPCCEDNPVDCEDEPCCMEEVQPEQEQE